MIKIDWNPIFHKVIPIDLSRKLAPKFLDNISKIESMGGYIAGGFARAIAQIDFNPNHPANKYGDIDIFLRTEQNYQPVHDFLREEYDYLMTTDYNGFEVDSFLYVDKKIQLIKTSYLDPEERMKQFDISVCKAYILNNNIHLTKECSEDSISLMMHYTKTTPIFGMKEVQLVLHRLVKYFEKGFNIELENIIKIYHKIIIKENRNHFVYCLKDYKNNIIDFDKFETIDKLCSL